MADDLYDPLPKSREDRIMSRTAAALAGFAVALCVVWLASSIFGRAFEPSTDPAPQPLDRHVQDDSGWQPAPVDGRIRSWCSEGVLFVMYDPSYAGYPPDLELIEAPDGACPTASSGAGPAIEDGGG